MTTQMGRYEPQVKHVSSKKPKKFQEVARPPKAFFRAS
ncbi:hypothetical protein HMPREF1246_0120 [Acidaminococcus sp. BV3L6]|nr:hypothetical protein HMPREF1246_0120 [Acidaminococcus sp. BV3L6]